MLAMYIFVLLNLLNYFLSSATVSIIIKLQLAHHRRSGAELLYQKELYSVVRSVHRLIKQKELFSVMRPVHR